MQTATRRSTVSAWPLLVEGHHDDGRAVVAAEAGLAQELGLALLERDRVDDAPALQLAQPGLEDRSISSCRPSPGRPRCRARRRSGAGTGSSRRPRRASPRPCSRRSAGPRWPPARGRSRPPRPRGRRRSSRANLREPVTFVRSPTLTKALPGGGMTTGSSPDSRVAGGTAGIARGASPATAAAIAATWAGVVPQQPPATLSSPCSAHSRIAAAICLGRLVVAAELVGQAGVRVGRDRPVGDPGQDVEVLAELRRPERAVEPDDHGVGVADAVPEGLDRLARQGPARGVDDRARDHQRHRARPARRRGSGRRRSPPWR